MPDSASWTTEDIMGMVSRALELMWMFPLHFFQWTKVLSVCVNEWIPLWKTCYWLYSNDDIIRVQKQKWVRGLPVAMTLGLLGLTVHKYRFTEAWKDKLYGVWESVKVVKMTTSYLIMYLFVGMHSSCGFGRNINVGCLFFNNIFILDDVHNVRWRSVH